VKFAEGLTDWIRGEDSCEAEAAAINVADVLLTLRAVARAVGGIKDG
jgi:hypothetical protein